MIFIHPEGHYDDSEDTLCIRVYKDDRLIPMYKPKEVLDNPYAIRFKKANDDMPDIITNYLNKEYFDKDIENPYESQMGSKIGGWPYWAQWFELDPENQFIMQVDEYGEVYWDWGDCPTLYVFRNIKTMEFLCSIQMY